jgi:hypothetical protein
MAGIGGRSVVKTTIYKLCEVRFEDPCSTYGIVNLRTKPETLVHEE